MNTFVEIFVGILAAIGFVFFASRGRKFVEEKQIYTVGLIVAALIYFGFGLFSEEFEWKIVEIGGVLIYGVFAWLGARKSGWFLAVGWAFHVFWDALLHGVSTPFVPHWYIGVCIGFDLVLAVYIGFREIRK